MIDELLLRVYRFEINLQFIDPAKLPIYKGSTFRGAFGITFRNAVCITKQPVCEGCMLKTNCSYFRVFETEMDLREVKYLTNVQKTPHPFIIDPPTDYKKDYKAGEILSLNLILFGDFADLLPYFVYTFIRMGQNGITTSRSRYKLLSVYSLDFENEKIKVYDHEREIVKTGFAPIELSPDFVEPVSNPEAIRLSFITPWRVQNEGNIVHDPAKVNISLLFKSLLIRLTTLGAAFGDKKLKFREINTDEILINENNLKFYELQRYSNRQSRKIYISGFTGSLLLTGNVSQIYPWLRIGEFVNIGKNTVFGLGKYILEIK